MTRASRILLGAALATGGLAAVDDAGAGTIGWAIAAVAVAAAVLFVLPRRPVAVRIAAAAVLGGITLWSWWVEPSLHHVKLLPAVAAMAWAAAETIVRQDRAGVEAACGVVAAAYVASAASKLIASGTSWFGGGGLALLVAERGGPTAGALGPLRDAIGKSFELCALLAAVAFLAEAAGALFVVRRFRVPFAVVATLMHVGIALLLGYVYVPWMLLAWGLALASRGEADVTSRS
jgi:hypothetical protein